MSTLSSLRIVNAWLADGTGAPLRRTGVLVIGGRVASVEPSDCGAAAAERVIDLGGRILAPGFIDAHGHSDMSLLAAPEAFSKVSQGVVTEIAGNCGLSVFPVTPRNRSHLEELYAGYGVRISWSDYSGFQAELARRGAALRLPALVGHNTLRAAVAGYEKEGLTPGELAEMKRLLAREFDAGSPGLSAGLLYVPGVFATAGEMMELMRVTAEYDRIFAVHLRSEGDRLLEALTEILDWAAAAGLRRLQISHFKTAGAANWGKLDAALELIERGRRSGMAVTLDRYPYIQSQTQLSVILPGEWSRLDDGAIGRRLQDAETRLRLAGELRASRPADYWKGVVLASTGSPRGVGRCGRPLCELGPDPALAVVELLADDAAGTTAAFAGMSAANLDRILALDYLMPGSDGNALPADYRFGRAHPRAFGAIAEFVRRRLDAGEAVESVVRRATGLPAAVFQLAGAGRVAPGLPADLTAFDPDEIGGGGDFSAPHAPARGVEFTMLGGRMVFRN